MSGARGTTQCPLLGLPPSGKQQSDLSAGCPDFYPIFAGLRLRQLFGTKDTSEKLFLTKPNPPCLFSNNRNSITALQILDLLILTSPACIELNEKTFVQESNLVRKICSVGTGTQI